MVQKNIFSGSDYTINIALCKKDRPIFSIIMHLLGELFVADKYQGATKNGEKIVIDSKISNLVHLVASKSHLNKKTEDYIEKISSGHNINLLQFGSSLKICKIAEGAAHLYPRFGPTMEWDTCAADLVLTEAGGLLVDMQKNRLLYNKQNLLNPYFISSVSKKLIL